MAPRIPSQEVRPFLCNAMTCSIVYTNQYFPDEGKSYSLSGLCAKVYIVSGTWQIRNFDAGCYEPGIADFDASSLAGEIPFVVRLAEDPYIGAAALSGFTFNFPETGTLGQVIAYSIIVFGVVMPICWVMLPMVIYKIRWRKRSANFRSRGA